MDVKQFRIINECKNKEMVAVLRQEYPKYGKAVQRMVEDPARYGVRLLPAAENLLWERLGLTERVSGDRHRNRRCFSCRVTEGRYSAVKQAVEADGRFPTVQAWLDWWIYIWLKGQERAGKAGGGGEERAGDPAGRCEHG